MISNSQLMVAIEWLYLTDSVEFNKPLLEKAHISWYPGYKNQLHLTYVLDPGVLLFPPEAKVSKTTESW